MADADSGDAKFVQIAIAKHDDYAPDTTMVALDAAGVVWEYAPSMAVWLEIPSERRGRHE